MKLFVIVGLLVLGSLSGSAQQLQTCYVGDQQGYYDSSTDSCVISSPWPDVAPPPNPSGPVCYDPFLGYPFEYPCDGYPLNP